MEMTGPLIVILRQHVRALIRNGSGAVSPIAGFKYQRGSED
jgi:hypothetical protein